MTLFQGIIKGTRSTWDSLGEALVSTFQLITYDNWNTTMALAIKASGWWAAFYFVSWVVIGVCKLPYCCYFIHIHSSIVRIFALLHVWCYCGIDILLNMFFAIVLENFERDQAKVMEHRLKKLKQRRAQQKDGHNDVRKAAAVFNDILFKRTQTQAGGSRKATSHAAAGGDGGNADTTKTVPLLLTATTAGSSDGAVRATTAASVVPVETLTTPPLQPVQAWSTLNNPSLGAATAALQATATTGRDAVPLSILVGATTATATSSTAPVATSSAPLLASHDSHKNGMQSDSGSSMPPFPKTASSGGITNIPNRSTTDSPNALLAIGAIITSPTASSTPIPSTSIAHMKALNSSMTSSPPPQSQLLHGVTNNSPPPLNGSGGRSLPGGPSVLGSTSTTGMVSGNQMFRHTTISSQGIAVTSSTAITRTSLGTVGEGQGLTRASTLPSHESAPSTSSIVNPINLTASAPVGTTTTVATGGTSGITATTPPPVRGNTNSPGSGTGTPTNNATTTIPTGAGNAFVRPAMTRMPTHTTVGRATTDHFLKLLNRARRTPGAPNNGGPRRGTTTGGPLSIGGSGNSPVRGQRSSLTSVPTAPDDASMLPGAIATTSPMNGNGNNGNDTTVLLRPPNRGGDGVSPRNSGAFPPYTTSTAGDNGVAVVADNKHHQSADNSIEERRRRRSSKRRSATNGGGHGDGALSAALSAAPSSMGAPAMEISRAESRGGSRNSRSKSRKSRGGGDSFHTSGTSTEDLVESHNTDSSFWSIGGASEKEGGVASIFQHSVRQAIQRRITRGGLDAPLPWWHIRCGCRRRGQKTHENNTVAPVTGLQTEGDGSTAPVTSSVRNAGAPTAVAAHSSRRGIQPGEWVDEVIASAHTTTETGAAIKSPRNADGTGSSGMKAAATNVNGGISSARSGVHSKSTSANAAPIIVRVDPASAQTSPRAATHGSNIQMAALSNGLNDKRSPSPTLSLHLPIVPLPSHLNVNPIMGSHQHHPDSSPPSSPPISGDGKIHPPVFMPSYSNSALRSESSSLLGLGPAPPHVLARQPSQSNSSIPSSHLFVDRILAKHHDLASHSSPSIIGYESSVTQSTTTAALASTTALAVIPTTISSSVHPTTLSPPAAMRARSTTPPLLPPLSPPRGVSSLPPPMPMSPSRVLPLTTLPLASTIVAHQTATPPLPPPPEPPQAPPPLSPPGLPPPSMDLISPGGAQTLIERATILSSAATATMMTSDDDSGTEKEGKEGKIGGRSSSAATKRSNRRGGATDTPSSLAAEDGLSPAERARLERRRRRGTPNLMNTTPSVVIPVVTSVGIVATPTPIIGDDTSSTKAAAPSIDVSNNGGMTTPIPVVDNATIVPPLTETGHGALTISSLAVSGGADTIANAGTGSATTRPTKQRNPNSAMVSQRRKEIERMEEKKEEERKAQRAAETASKAAAALAAATTGGGGGNTTDDEERRRMSMGDGLPGAESSSEFLRDRPSSIGIGLSQSASHLMKRAILDSDDDDDDEEDKVKLPTFIPDHFLAPQSWFRKLSAVVFSRYFQAL
jgi:hypothetical protein